VAPLLIVKVADYWVKLTGVRQTQWWKRWQHMCIEERDLPETMKGGQSGGSTNGVINWLVDMDEANFQIPWHVYHRNPINKVMWFAPNRCQTLNYVQIKWCAKETSLKIWKFHPTNYPKYNSTYFTENSCLNKGSHHLFIIWKLLEFTILFFK